MKRQTAISCVFLLMLIALSWGGGQTEAAVEVTTVTFWFPGGAGQEEYFNNVGKEFEAATPSIKIDPTVLPPDSKDIDSKLNAAKLAGTFPDVFSAYLVFMGTRGARGDFEILDPYINQWPDKSDILESALDLGKYKGDIVGLGFFPAPKLVPYRKDFFREAGLDPEGPKKEPTTWEELASWGRKLTVRDASGNVTRAGLDIPSSTPATVFIEPWMRQNGSKVIDEINLEPSWTDAGAVEALQFVADLWNENISIPHNL
jgi:ABC-type glycerol-3-phosphate transport system substrate-binding protein